MLNYSRPNWQGKGPVASRNTMVGGTGIEICPFQEKRSTFKEFQVLKAQIHNPFIRGEEGIGGVGGSNGAPFQTVQR